MDIRRIANRFVSKIEFKFELALFTGFLLGVPLAYLFCAGGLSLNKIIADGALLYSRYVKIEYARLFFALLFRRGLELGFLALLMIRRKKKWDFIIAAFIGLKAGLFVTLCILRFAFAGFIFALISCMPHGIFYLLALFLAYYAFFLVPKNCCPDKSIKIAILSGRLFPVILSIVVAIIGILSECYVNSLLEKIFFHLFC